MEIHWKRSNAGFTSEIGTIAKRESNWVFTPGAGHPHLHAITSSLLKEVKSDAVDQHKKVLRSNPDRSTKALLDQAIVASEKRKQFLPRDEWESVVQAALKECRTLVANSGQLREALQRWVARK